MHKRFNLMAIAVTATLSLTSCSNNPAATDDSETESLTAQSLATFAFESIAADNASAELLDMTNPAPESLLVPPSITATVPIVSTQLSKKAVTGSFNLDTIGNLLRITTNTSGALTDRFDTIDVKFDETVFDAIEGNESVTSIRGKTSYLSGTEELYAVSDQDGDGSITTGSGSPKAQFDHVTIFSKTADGHVAGEKKYATFEVGAGMDGSFSLENDNTLRRVHWVKTIGSDTIAYAHFDDVDGDGTIAEKCAGTIDISFFETRNIAKPLVSYGKVSLRLERFADGREHLSRFAATEELKTGRINKVWVTDEQGDSLLAPDKLALVYFATTYPAGADSEATASVIYTINPGKNIGDTGDNLCHKISFTKTYRFGPRSKAAFECTFSPAVPHGAQPEKGMFNLSIEYKNGTTSSLDGVFSNNTIEGTYMVNGKEAEQVTLTK